MNDGNGAEAVLGILKHKIRAVDVFGRFRLGVGGQNRFAEQLLPLDGRFDGSDGKKLAYHDRHVDDGKDESRHRLQSGLVLRETLLHGGHGASEHVPLIPVVIGLGSVCQREILVSRCLAYGETRKRTQLTSGGVLRFLDQLFLEVRRGVVQPVEMELPGARRHSLLVDEAPGLGVEGRHDELADADDPVADFPESDREGPPRRRHEHGKDLFAGVGVEGDERGRRSEVKNLSALDEVADTRLDSRISPLDLAVGAAQGKQSLSDIF